MNKINLMELIPYEYKAFVEQVIENDIYVSVEAMLKHGAEYLFIKDGSAVIDQVVQGQHPEPERIVRESLEALINAIGEYGT